VTRLERFVQVVRFAVLVVVVIASLATIWGSHRRANADDFTEDLAAGDVESFSVGPTDLIQPGWQFSCGAGTANEQSPVAAWTTGPWPWQRFSFSTNELSGGQREARKLVEDAGLEATNPGTNWVALGAFAAFLVVVAAIAYGPQPRRFTKWGAFWMATLPLGVGQVWLLVAEAPWSRAASATAEPLPHRRQVQTPEGDSRRTWFVPFLAAVFTGSVVTSLLHQLP
jgi:hypothetical protein